MIHLNDAGHINNGNEIITPGFTTAQWQKMEEFLTKANEIGLLEENEFEAVKQAIQCEDAIIPALFNRSNKNLRTFTNLLKKKVWELLNDETPRRIKSVKTTTTRSSETDPLYQARESQGSRRSSAFNQRRRTSKLSIRTRPATGTDFHGFNIADEAQKVATETENASAAPNPRSRTNSSRPVSTMAGSRIEIHDPSSNQPPDPKPRLGSRPTSLFLGSKQDIHGSQAHMDPKSKPTSRPASLFISSRPTSLFLDKRSVKGSVDQVSSSVNHSQRLAPSPQGSAMNSMRPSIVTSRSMEYPQHCPELDAAIAAISESAENSRAGSRASTRPSSAIFPSHMIRIEPPTPRESTFGERKPEESGTVKAALVLSSVAESSAMPSEDNLPLSQLQSQTPSQMTEKSVGVELKPLELKPASTLSMPNVLSIVEPSTLSSASVTSLKKASSVQDNTTTVQIVVPVGVRKSSSFSGSQKLTALDIIAEDSEGTPQIPQTRSFEAPPSQKQPKKDITKSEGSLSVTASAPPPKLRGKPVVPAVVVPPPKEEPAKAIEPAVNSYEVTNAAVPIPMIVMVHPSETEIVVDLSANATNTVPQQQSQQITEESSGNLVPKPPSSLSPISPVSPKPRFRRASNISEKSSPTSPNPVHPDIPRPANKE
ncbi:hypothetical protein BCR33DRAFT_722694 [Rhizoclosmatium globosum]|uniref:Uncharacterized protein n=1 Tax=Rhizoclosmatium globosum TaxID=329046 RepID=A0A1Y2BI43_9FUNG|nr:hypothetical protein BCR33DRAFT_722694 [Rhizoclosmatium globosum]|eukprot:ORY34461.1 hypothetical protein BCR33DRAFT_722694 [Rhizoclosmatium globosum]